MPPKTNRRKTNRHKTNRRKLSLKLKKTMKKCKHKRCKSGCPRKHCIYYKKRGGSALPVIVL